MKLVWDEPGTPAMRGHFVAGEAVSSEFTYVELRSALAGAYRQGRVLAEDLASLRQVLDRTWRELVALPVVPGTLAQAGELAEAAALRPGDAVQLATLGFAGPPSDVRFACWDVDLRRAATGLGYRLIPLALDESRPHPAQCRSAASANV